MLVEHAQEVVHRLVDLLFQGIEVLKSTQCFIDIKAKWLL